jgi:hypothetical protein
MSYDLHAIEQACVQHDLPFRWCDESEIEVDIVPTGTLVFANTDAGADTYLGFRGIPWHSYAELILMTGDATYLEYAPEQLITALVTGEVLVVSQYHRGELKDRWLVHRDEKLAVRYIETDEEVRVCRIAEPASRANRR